MKSNRRVDLIFYAFAILVSSIYFIQLPQVPFHPDESTQIFMSSDVALFFDSPANLYWTDPPQDPLRQRYRELDAPLPRMLIGIGRALFNLPALQNDWNWSNNWVQNASNAALPDQNLLLHSRYFVAFVFPFSLILLYEIGKRISNRAAGWAAAVLFVGNPHILLHTRRAMSESILVFFVILSIFWVLKSNKNAWLSAVPVALAFNSKQSAAGLVAAALLIVILQNRNVRPKKLIASTLLFIVTFGAITFLLNPFLWKHPLSAVLSAVESRQNLALAQMETFSQYKDEIVLDNLPEKSLSLFAQVFFGPPQYAESGNYLNELNQEINIYQAHWSNRLFSHQILNILVLIFSVVGIVKSISLSGTKTDNSKMHLSLNLLFIPTFLAILLLVPLSFQRYYLPLVPFLCIFAAVLIADLGAAFFSKIKQ